jgi:hypothetical protein
VAAPASRRGERAVNDESQFGEDAILRRLFGLLDVGEGWCVEFGAWDGVHLSNTSSLLRRQQWRGVLIEADPARFAELESNMRAYPQVTCLNRMVGFTAIDGLDSILRETEAPADFDLLSIDIDGNDYHVWEAVTGYRPKVVVIEFNPTIPNHVEFVQRRDPSVSHGNSLLSLTRLGERKGYQLAATTTTNGIFVRSDLFPRTGVSDNSLDALRPSQELHTTLFQLYDGTLVLDGFRYLLWHDMPISAERLQVLPRRLRRFPGGAPPRALWLLHRWRDLERAKRVLRRMTGRRPPGT